MAYRRPTHIRPVVDLEVSRNQYVVIQTDKGQTDKGQTDKGQEMGWAVGHVQDLVFTQPCLPNLRKGAW